jgi:cell division protein FtsL
MRTFVIFMGCLTLLAVGRVALSFAVVQKTLQTDAIVREERRISDKNDQLEGQLAQLASPVRIQHIAETQLGLVLATQIAYPEPLLPKGGRKVAAVR